jgi:hypothetical protein
MSHNGADLLAELEHLGVTVGAENGRIWYEPRTLVGPDLVARLREHKSEVLGLLGHGTVGPFGRDKYSARCRTHIDHTTWIDQPAPDRTGWILTTCSRCGNFIGYRPK